MSPLKIGTIFSGATDYKVQEISEVLPPVNSIFGVDLEPDDPQFVPMSDLILGDNIFGDSARIVIPQAKIYRQVYGEKIISGIFSLAEQL